MKDFSYQFYPGDVLRDIQFFNNTQKGIYLTLMTCHIEKICFSYDFIMKITKELNDTERLEFMEIFTKIDEENYVILWVQKAIEKRSSYIASRSENKKGKTKNKDIEEESYDNHMVNEDIKENKDVIKPKNNKSEKNEILDKKIKESIGELEYNYEEPRIALIKKWLVYKKEKGKKYTESGFEAFLKKHHKYSDDIFEKMIENSMSNGYDGIFEIKDVLEPKKDYKQNSSLKEVFFERETNKIN